MYTYTHLQYIYTCLYTYTHLQYVYRNRMCIDNISCVAMEGSYVFPPFAFDKDLIYLIHTYVMHMYVYITQFSAQFTQYGHARVVCLPILVPLSQAQEPSTPFYQYLNYPYYPYPYSFYHTVLRSLRYYLS